MLTKLVSVGVGFGVAETVRKPQGHGLVCVEFNMSVADARFCNQFLCVGWSI